MPAHAAPLSAIRPDGACPLQPPGRKPGELQRLRIADIGCGAGLMCEPLAARGAQVLGVDAASNSIAAARLHAAESNLAIDYRHGEPRDALRAGAAFDLMLLLEVVEHVDHLQRFIQEAVSKLKPGGLLLVSTINRMARSWATAIVGAEYIFRVLPRGTHHWAQLVRPAELNEAARDCGLLPHDRRGMRCLPLIHRAWWTKDLSVNCIASFNKSLDAD